MTKGIYAIRAAEPQKTIGLIQHELGEALDRDTGGSAIRYWQGGHIPADWAEVEGLAVQFILRAHVDHVWVARFLDSAGAPDPQLLADQLFARALGAPSGAMKTAVVTPAAPHLFTLGPIETPLAIVDGNGRSSYTPETIHCHFDPTPFELPPELNALKAKIADEQEARRRTGKSYMWNGEIYGLRRFSRGRTSAEELLEIDIWFGKTDWFSHVATGHSLDTETVYDAGVGRYVTLREKYLAHVDWSDPATQPVPEMANSCGVVIALITADDYIIFTVRSDLVGSLQNAHNSAINEGLQFPLDRSPYGDEPDPYRTTLRGGTEELGIQLRPEEITLLGLASDTRQGDWGFLGYARTAHTLQEVYDRRRLLAKDRWEVKQLEAVRFTARDVVRHIAEHEPWAPGTLATTYYTLVNHFGVDAVEKAIRAIF